MHMHMHMHKHVGRVQVCVTSCDRVIYDLSQVHQLLEAARSEENLCRMFDGWAAWC